MKNSLLIFLPLIFLFFCPPSKGGTHYDSLGKAAVIVYFRIESANPGIPDESLLEPLYSQLKRVFKLDSVTNLEERTVFWTNDLVPLPDSKKLQPEDRGKIPASTNPLVFGIRVEHLYTAILGGMVKGRRHVLLFTCALYDKSGNQVWSVKKKDACCKGFGSAYETTPDPISADSFLKMYHSVLEQAFGRL